MTKQQLRRALKKIKNLEDMVQHLQNQSHLNEDMKESLMVCTSVSLSLMIVLSGLEKNALKKELFLCVVSINMTHL